METIFEELKTCVRVIPVGQGLTIASPEFLEVFSQLFEANEYNNPLIIRKLEQKLKLSTDKRFEHHKSEYNEASHLQGGSKATNDEQKSLARYATSDGSSGSEFTLPPDNTEIFSSSTKSVQLPLIHFQAIQGNEADYDEPDVRIFQDDEKLCLGAIGVAVLADNSDVVLSSLMKEFEMNVDHMEHNNPYGTAILAKSLFVIITTNITSSTESFTPTSPELQERGLEVVYVASGDYTVQPQLQLKKCLERFRSKLRDEIDITIHAGENFSASLEKKRKSLPRANTSGFMSLGFESKASDDSIPELPDDIFSDQLEILVSENVLKVFNVIRLSENSANSSAKIRTFSDVSVPDVTLSSKPVLRNVFKERAAKMFSLLGKLSMGLGDTVNASKLLNLALIMFKTLTVEAALLRTKELLLINGAVKSVFASNDEPIDIAAVKKLIESMSSVNETFLQRAKSDGGVLKEMLYFELQNLHTRIALLKLHSADDNSPIATIILLQINKLLCLLTLDKCNISMETLSSTVKFLKNLAKICSFLDLKRKELFLEFLIIRTIETYGSSSSFCGEFGLRILLGLNSEYQTMSARRITPKNWDEQLNAGNLIPRSILVVAPHADNPRRALPTIFNTLASAETGRPFKAQCERIIENVCKHSGGFNTIIANTPANDDPLNGNCILNADLAASFTSTAYENEIFQAEISKAPGLVKGSILQGEIKSTTEKGSLPFDEISLDEIDQNAKITSPFLFLPEEQPSREMKCGDNKIPAAMYLVSVEAPCEEEVFFHLNFANMWRIELPLQNIALIIDSADNSPVTSSKIEDYILAVSDDDNLCTFQMYSEKPNRANVQGVEFCLLGQRFRTYFSSAVLINFISPLPQFTCDVYFPQIGNSRSVITPDTVSLLLGECITGRLLISNPTKSDLTIDSFEIKLEQTTGQLTRFFSSEETQTIIYMEPIISPNIILKSDSVNEFKVMLRGSPSSFNSWGNGQDVCNLFKIHVCCRIQNRELHLEKDLVLEKTITASIGEPLPFQHILDRIGHETANLNDEFWNKKLAGHGLSKKERAALEALHYVLLKVHVVKDELQTADVLLWIDYPEDFNISESLVSKASKFASAILPTHECTCNCHCGKHGLMKLNDGLPIREFALLIPSEKLEGQHKDMMEVIASYKVRLLVDGNRSAVVSLRDLLL